MCLLRLRIVKIFEVTSGGNIEKSQGALWNDCFLVQTIA